ncbi:MAG: hypothetical protein RXR03_04100 [Thermocladium sp.]
MRMNRLLLFGYALASVSPLPLAVSHEDPLYAALSSLAISPLAALVYLLIRRQWSSEGFYGYARTVSPLLAKIQLYAWILSYFLYIVYTIDYIVFYVLNLSGALSILLTLLLPAAASLLVISELVYPALLAASLIQVALSVPLGWSFSPSLYTPHDAFLNILSTSLLLVCITLVPYIDGDTRAAWVAPLAFILSSSLMVLGGLFMAPRIIYYLQSIGQYSIILVEYAALNGLLRRGLRIRGSSAALVSLVMALSAISLINYGLFYELTIIPSISALYFSLIIAALLSAAFLRRRIAYLLASFSILLMLYGLINVFMATRGPYLIDAALGLIAPIIAVLMKKYNSAGGAVHQ